jgi:DNA invertase Pin-like site-specific DNA recombinase
MTTVLKTTNPHTSSSALPTSDVRVLRGRSRIKNVVGRAAADLAGWQFLDEHIYCDYGVSGSSLSRRAALWSLLANVHKRPRPFDYLIVDDVARLGRNLDDVLTVTEILKHQNVHVYFASMKLDSKDANFRMCLTIHRMFDEYYVNRLRSKIHSCQKEHR